ncbi:MAG: hypothetical protein JWO73_154 [Candidatus Taylorbacteria bacterium]|nr:hypothetical protein [Candidatus Taylorbacteria bacterium]
MKIQNTFNIPERGEVKRKIKYALIFFLLGLCISAALIVMLFIFGPFLLVFASGSSGFIGTLLSAIVGIGWPVAIFLPFLAPVIGYAYGEHKGNSSTAMK